MSLRWWWRCCKYIGTILLYCNKYTYAITENGPLSVSVEKQDYLTA